MEFLSPNLHPDDLNIRNQKSEQPISCPRLSPILKRPDSVQTLCRQLFVHLCRLIVLSPILNVNNNKYSFLKKLLSNPSQTTMLGRMPNPMQLPDNPLHISWHDSNWIPILNGQNVLDYFSDKSNPFYDRTCNNETLRMQRQSMENLK